MSVLSFVYAASQVARFEISLLESISRFKALSFESHRLLILRNSIVFPVFHLSMKDDRKDQNLSKVSPKKEKVLNTRGGNEALPHSVKCI